VRSGYSVTAMHDRRFVPATTLIATILVFCPAFSFAKDQRVKLNESAFAYAKELIVQGHVVLDKKNEWANHHPTSQQENDFIRDHGFAQYANWHLGIDETHAQNSKARYKFPFGDYENIHRCALLAVRSRAHQYGYSNIENVADRLLEMMDSKRKQARTRKSRASPRAIGS